jgi:hypothetical protein
MRFPFIGIMLAFGCNNASPAPVDSDSGTAIRNGPPSSPTVTVVTDDGRTYSGRCGIVVTNDGVHSPSSGVNIDAWSADGMKWSAQLSPAVDDVRAGTAIVLLKPWSQAPGTGFIDDQNGNAAQFSQSGSATLHFAAGGHLAGSVRSDTDRFSGTIEGNCPFGCAVPASLFPPPAGGGSGTPSSGIAMAADTNFVTDFCRPFAVYR